MSRVWAAWFGVIQGRWKQRVEKACQVLTMHIITVACNSMIDDNLTSIPEQSRRSVCGIDWAI